MIQVYLSVNNNGQVIKLPVPPKDYEIPSPWANQKLDGLQGPINRIGRRDLRSLEIESFFPLAGHDYPFIQNRTMWGWDYVDTVERWRSRMIPIRLVIADSSGKKNVNMPVTIDNFTYGQRQDGDIYYRMQMTEFIIFSNLKR